MPAGRRARATVWAMPFAVLFLLSLDYWAWGRATRLGPFNLPTWIYYFGALQLALAGCLFWFGRTFWPDGDPTGEEESGAESE